MIRLIAILFCCVALKAEVVDRLAIAIGLTTITDLQLDEELRVTAFLNEKPIVRDVSTLRAAADRMVEQYLIKREMEISDYPLPTVEQINSYLEQLRSRSGGEEHFSELLKKYDLTEKCLKDHLALQLTTLQFIEYRFRPDIGISESEIKDSYVHAVEDWRRNHPGVPPPSLESQKDFIEKNLVTERTDQALSAWLEESRRQVDIVYLDPSLR